MAFHLAVFRAIVLIVALCGLVSAIGYNYNNNNNNNNNNNVHRAPAASPHRQPDRTGTHRQPDRTGTHRQPDDDRADGTGNHVEWIWDPELAPSNTGQNARYVVQPPSDFSYTANGGSKNWPALFNGCSGNHQSPIKIHRRNTQKRRVPILKFKHYWDNENAALINNTGKRVDVLLEGKRKMPTLSGGPLTDEYEFAELHFHWGKNNKEGSEHTLDNLVFPMEAHMVHFKKAYGDENEAAKFPDGFAVVAFFFKVDKKDNKGIAELITHLKRIKRAYSTNELPSAGDAFRWFEDAKVTQGPYFSYQGSLTTPPCSEVVVWIIYQDPIAISMSQMEEFRKLLNPDGRHITENHRVTQNHVQPDIMYVL